MAKVIEVYNAHGEITRIEAPPPNGEGEWHSYCRTHLASGDRTMDGKWFRNHHAFLSCLDLWNIQGRGVWLYTSEIPIPLVPTQEEP